MKDDRKMVKMKEMKVEGLRGVVLCLWGMSKDRSG